MCKKYPDILLVTYFLAEMLSRKQRINAVLFSNLIKVVLLQYLARQGSVTSFH